MIEQMAMQATGYMQFSAKTRSFHPHGYLIYEGLWKLNTNPFGKALLSHNLGIYILVINKLTVGGRESKFLSVSMNNHLSSELHIFYGTLFLSFYKAGNKSFA